METRKTDVFAAKREKRKPFPAGETVFHKAGLRAKVLLPLRRALFEIIFG